MSAAMGDHSYGASSARLALVVALLLTCGCRGPQHGAASLPARHKVKTDQLSVLSDVRLPKNHALIRDLETLRQEVSTTLNLPMQEQPVTVYLFGDEVRYAQYLRAAYPDLPPRRAYFVGTSTELAVYTFWGERVQEDLRHEYTHGVLHACLKDVPLWLDEGLAEYFEVVDQPVGWNRDYVDRLGEALANGWRPDMQRLESLETVAQMQKGDYFEAWAWVHFLLNDSDDSRSVLLSYLHELRDNPRPGPLTARLHETIPQADQRFLAHASSISKGITTAGGQTATQR